MRCLYLRMGRVAVWICVCRLHGMSCDCICSLGPLLVLLGLLWLMGGLAVGILKRLLDCA